MSDTPTLTKQILLEKWAFIIDQTESKYRDESLKPAERAEAFKIFLDATYKATTLVKETDMEDHIEQIAGIREEMKKIREQQKLL